MKRYIVSPAARQDLAGIRDYLVRQASADVAAHVLTRLREGMERIAGMPNIGHLRHDLGAGSLRFHRVFKYLIIYRAERAPVEVVRVLHAARDVAHILAGE